MNPSALSLQKSPQHLDKPQCEFSPDVCINDTAPEAPWKLWGRKSRLLACLSDLMYNIYTLAQ